MPVPISSVEEQKEGAAEGEEEGEVSGAGNDTAELVHEVRELLERHQATLHERFDFLIARQDEMVAGLMRQSPRHTPHSPRGGTGSHCLQADMSSVRSVPSMGRGGRVNPNIRSYAQSEGKISTIPSDRMFQEVDSEGLLYKAYAKKGKTALFDFGSGKMATLKRNSEENEGRAARRKDILAALGLGSQDPEGGLHDVSSMRVSLGPAAQKKQSLGEMWRSGLSREAIFDFVCGFMVVVNGILIGVETEYMTHNNGVSSPGFLIAQLSLNVWFIFELLIRFWYDNWRFFSSSEWKWNAFDSLLVIVSLVDIVQIAQTGVEMGVMIGGRMMRIVRLARVVRTLRLMRSLNYIHEFRKMVYSLQATLSTLMWSLLLLFAVMYAFAVLFVQGAAETIYRQSQDSEVEADEQLLRANYGNMMTAVVTLYKSISNGVSWGKAMEPLADVDETFGVLFVVYVSIVFFGVLNVVSAVFVESAMASAAHYKDLRIYESRRAKAELVRHMREVFRQIDEDESGAISFEQMDRFLSDPQLKMYVESLEVTVEDTAMLFQLMDLDDSGVVDIDEFCTGLMRLQGDARSFDMHLLIFEMTKFHKQWDNFIHYVEIMFNEVIDVVYRHHMSQDKGARQSPQLRYAAQRGMRTSSKESSPVAAPQTTCHEDSSPVHIPTIRCSDPGRRIDVEPASAEHQPCKTKIWPCTPVVQDGSALKVVVE